MKFRRNKTFWPLPYQHHALPPLRWSIGAFECGGIDGKLGGLTPMNSYPRLVCIRGIKITVLSRSRQPGSVIFFRGTHKVRDTFRSIFNDLF